MFCEEETQFRLAKHDRPKLRNPASQKQEVDIEAKVVLLSGATIRYTALRISCYRETPEVVGSEWLHVLPPKSPRMPARGRLPYMAIAPSGSGIPTHLLRLPAHCVAGLDRKSVV